MPTELATRESLYLIEETLQDLMDERSIAESEGDTDALNEIDICIATYLTKEAAKVTSYVNLIRSREMTAQACDQEIERLKAIKDAATRDVDKLKQTAMEVMNRFGVRELKAKPGGGLQIRGNGGLQPLEIPEWPKDSSGRFVPLSAEQLPVPMDFVKTYFLPHTERLRETLRRCVPCPQCGKMTESEIGDDVCFTCNGERTIPATVPGARLLERGEHLRVL